MPPTKFLRHAFLAGEVLLGGFELGVAGELCLGGGVEIALACDLRYCGASAEFGIPAAKLGLGYNIEGHKRLLETVVPANCVSLPLRIVAPSVYAAAIEHDRYLDAPEWYFALNADVPTPDLIRRARDRKEIATNSDPEALARIGTATLHTLAVRSRAGHSRKELSNLVAAAIDAICRS